MFLLKIFILLKYSIGFLLPLDIVLRHLLVQFIASLLGKEWNEGEFLCSIHYLSKFMQKTHASASTEVNWNFLLTCMPAEILCQASGLIEVGWSC